MDVAQQATRMVNDNNSDHIAGYELMITFYLSFQYRQLTDTRLRTQHPRVKSVVSDRPFNQSKTETQ